MNSFARRMMEDGARGRSGRRSMRDGRNPYGSRGGYVTSRSPRRDRAEDYEEYMEDGRQGVRGTGRYGIGGSRYDRNSGYSEDYARSGNDYAYNEDYGYGVGYVDFADDYNDYNYSRNDYNYGRDGHYKLTSKDIKKWERHLENADGTTGKHFDIDQIRQVAQQIGIRFDEYSPELLCAIVNMMYSDYCKVLGNDLMLYVKLAKAFLEDDDFDGTPEEKAYLYYKCIVEKD